MSIITEMTMLLLGLGGKMENRFPSAGVEVLEVVLTLLRTRKEIRAFSHIHLK